MQISDVSSMRRAPLKTQAHQYYAGTILFKNMLDIGFERPAQAPGGVCRVCSGLREKLISLLVTEYMEVETSQDNTSNHEQSNTR